MRKFDIEEIRKTIAESSDETSIYVGCDSRKFRHKGRGFAGYTTVVVIHMDSCRGCKVYAKYDVLPDHGKIKQRMLNEVAYAVNVAYDLLDDIGERHLEIHIDVNPSPRHASHVAVKEAIGYVRGMGMTPQIKPDAAIASTAADLIGKKYRYRIPKELLN
jgi:predicted RNase H-related nuclease YkuK (DUF458 family)